MTAKEKNNDRRKFDIEFIARLVVVETKLDNIIDEMATVKSDLKASNGDMKAYIREQVGAQKMSSDNIMAASKEAITKAEVSMAERLAGMNEFGGQQKDMINTLMPRSEAVTMFENVNKEIKNLLVNQTLNAGAKTGVADFKSWITWVILVVGFLTTYFVLRGGV